MRLKELELQGYKTFAGKTQFVFTGGLTAIIGPNGSGKSNIADAIQWVLGEQNFGLLRAKRSEDMIFSGSNERSRMGMAQATLTLDNADGWLPIDYGEVVIARRTFRSGENEYYVNGTRVRLRDVTDLLAASGLSKRTYTVIGQGLVDQALSLRPDERRALIEEAAGITGYQAKRGRALRQLEETRHNLERVDDILQEITPRLRYLRRQAERAEERLQVQADLDAQLRIWYGFRWHQGLLALDEAYQRENASRALVEARRETLRRASENEEQLRKRYTGLRNQLGDWHRESSALHRQAEMAQRELAVGGERLRQLKQRRVELLQEVEPLVERLQAQMHQVEQTQASADSELANLKSAQQAIEDAQATVDVVETDRKRSQQQLMELRHQVADWQQHLNDQERRGVELTSRKRTLAEEAIKIQAELTGVQSREAELASQIAIYQAQIEALEQDGQALMKRRQELLNERQHQEAELSERAQSLASEHRLTDRLQDQLDLLLRLKEEGEGYSGGARSIIRAVNSPQPLLQGIIGTVADQLRVPAELELAIETALGGRLQDVVVERWEHAEAAIAWLKDTRGGRATFLPLDSLRPAARLHVPAGPGIVGLAADLVSAERHLDAVVDYLLGRVVVTRDLPTARRVLDSTREHPTVVTLEGDIVRPGGSVSGGSQATRRDQGVLARERALRELPDRLAQSRQGIAELEQAQAGIRAALTKGQEALHALDTQIADLTRQQQAQSAVLANLQGQAVQMTQELKARQDRLETTRREQAAIEDHITRTHERIQQLLVQIDDGETAVTAAETAMKELDTSSLVADLMEQRSRAEVVKARLTSQQALLANQQRTLAQLQSEIRSKEERAGTLAAELEALHTRLQALQASENQLSAEIARYAALIEPGEAELAALEAERGQLSGEQNSHRNHLDQEELSHQTTLLALQRARDELAHLRSEIEHDVGLVELEHGEELVDQPPLPLRPLVERLPVVEVLAEGTEEEIRRLRMQYNRLGSVNPNAPEEYAAALERHDFLTSQAEDLEQAARSLETVIQELDEVIQKEFMHTFRAVAREFKDKFTQLFGGGTARLELSEPDNPMTSGIEIVVRPPGKRAQPLPLLSGGERSLTAAALLLSILQISPPPFCILDEVDAALDEVNVDRFRTALREAARDTQFVIITHNRGTIEAADTIYGISMGSDSTSQVLSLHLEDRDGRRELVADH